MWGKDDSCNSTLAISTYASYANDNDILIFVQYSWSWEPNSEFQIPEPIKIGSTPQHRSS